MKMFVSRKRRLFNQIRNFLVLIFLCWCYRRSLLRQSEQLTQERPDDRKPPERAKFFAQNNKNDMKNTTEMNVLPTEPKEDIVNVKTTLAELITEHKTEEITPETTSSTPPTINTESQLIESPLVVLEAEIMQHYIKPPISKATSSFGFNSTASDEKSLLPITTLNPVSCGAQNLNLSASLIITFYNEHWTTLWDTWLDNLFHKLQIVTCFITCELYKLYIIQCGSIKYQWRLYFNLSTSDYLNLEVIQP